MAEWNCYVTKLLFNSYSMWLPEVLFNDLSKCHNYQVAVGNYKNAEIPGMISLKDTSAGASCYSCGWIQVDVWNSFLTK